MLAYPVLRCYTPGAPKDIYQRPANLFVASFIGQTNLIEAKLRVEKDETFVIFKNGYQLKINTVSEEHKHDQSVIVSIRPEEFEIVEQDTGLTAVMDNYAFLGLNTNYFAHAFDDKRIEIVQESSIEEIIEPNSTVFLRIKAEKINIFTENGQINIVKGVANDYDQYKSN